MSQLSANSLMPLISALPDEEQHVLAEKLQKFLKKKAAPAPKRKKSIMDEIADQLGEEWRPGNEDMLMHEIMYGK